MWLRIKMLLLGVVCLSLMACSNSLPANSAIDNVTIAVTPSPVAPDKTTVVGRVSSAQGGTPLSTTVRLAEVIRKDGQSIMALNGANSPGAETNKDGTFVISNIDAKEYVVVVGDIYGKYVIISEAQDKARVFQTKPGTITNVGELRVSL